MSAAERASLEDSLRHSTTSWKRWKDGAENSLVLWSVSMLVLLLAWAGLAW